MRKATVKHRFYGAADGQFHGKWYNPGDTITGDLARAMVDADNAEWEGAKDEKKPPHNKDLGKPGRNKTSLSSPPGQASQKKTARRSRAKAKSSQ